MSYFPKASEKQFLPKFPTILLLTIYKNLLCLNGDLFGLYYIKTEKNNCLSYELPLNTYLACWRLSLLLVSDIIEEKLSYEKEEIKVNQTFSSDLGTDSIDLVEIAIYLEKITNVSISEKTDFKTILDLIDYVFLILVSRVKKNLLLQFNKTETVFEI